ncbi:hypothetical protein A5695_25275 [Mycobacterium sp. E1747]|nr:hypothetical protein A5695_25275 [Mycobacterium sp. E1747]
MSDNGFLGQSGAVGFPLHFGLVVVLRQSFPCRLIAIGNEYLCVPRIARAVQLMRLFSRSW